MPLHHFSQSLSRAVHAAQWQTQYPLRRRMWHAMSRLGLTGLHSAPIHRNWLDVRRLQMPLRGLDAAFEGVRLIQISDLHLSPMVWRGFLAEQLRHVADLRPDLLVVTGDLITGGYRYARLAADLLAGIHPRPPLGTICILGNHDYSVTGKSNPLEARRRYRYFQQVMSDRGLILLCNQVHRIDLPDAEVPLTIVGLDDLWTGRLDAEAAFAGVDPQEPIICLNHDPRNALELIKYPWQWMLAGHTHGRQLGTSRVGQRFNRKRRREFVRGLYSLPEGRKLYVNRGLSYGQRFESWCKPEITVFRLTNPDKPAAPETVE